MPLRLAYMGTPDFAVPALLALLDAGHEIAAVYTQPPRPAGRGYKLQPSPVQRVAEERGLPVRHPKTLRTPEAQAEFASLGLDAAVVAAYGLILPQPVLDAPRLGCCNIHASLLPRWRGAAPIHRAILEGDTETGVTIMRMEAGLDTGPMLLMKRVPIGPEMTTPELHDTLAALGAKLIVPALEAVAAGTAVETPQPEAGVTYAAKIGPEDGRIDWADAAAVDRQVRALTPKPGAWFEYAGERIKVLAAAPTEGSGAPGTVLDDKLTVACGRGAIRLLRLQRPGKAPVPARDLLNGFPIPAGTILS
ncbi:methionyl-tRNA formyltransferase [Inquilinus limosus]|uniref:methionyl-tRNA formyltransferase n=1 Tax=Inquilinus limosus TaxID=171674 RepID=UPI003F180698